MVYLRYAEALNRAGYPQSAMLILKHGLCNDNAKNYVDSLEYAASKRYITFDETIFKARTSTASTPVAPATLVRHALRRAPAGYTTGHPSGHHRLPDPWVEDMIINEMALKASSRDTASMT